MLSLTCQPSNSLQVEDVVFITLIAARDLYMAVAMTFDLDTAANLLPVTLRIR
jgi:hypothetical protein